MNCVDFNIDKTLYSKRPLHKRSTAEEKVYDVLEALSICYERSDHDEAATIEKCQKIESILNAKIVKNLFLCNTQKTKFYLLIMPGDKIFKTKDLSKQINSARLSFAGAEPMKRLLGVNPGSVSIFGLLNDTENKVRLLIDRDILKNEFIGFHPCKNTSTLKLRTCYVIEKFLPYVKHEPTFVELPNYSAPNNL